MKYFMQNFAISGTGGIGLLSIEKNLIILEKSNVLAFPQKEKCKRPNETVQFGSAVCISLFY